MRIIGRSLNSFATEPSTTSVTATLASLRSPIFWRVFQRMPARAFPERGRSEGQASQAHPAFADVSRIIVNRKENAATQTAALIIPAVGNNKLRHETLQRFMLANDSVTVAVEIPSG